MVAIAAPDGRQTGNDPEEVLTVGGRGPSGHDWARAEHVDEIGRPWEQQCRRCGARRRMELTQIRREPMEVLDTADACDSHVVKSVMKS